MRRYSFLIAMLIGIAVWCLVVNEVVVRLAVSNGGQGTPFINRLIDSPPRSPQ